MCDERFVSLVRCPSYEAQAVRDALENLLLPYGMLDFVKPDMKVAVKANLVAMMRPEQAATTHPALLCALTDMLRERGATVTIGDSPGGLFTPVFVERIYAAAGMKEAEAHGATLNQNFETAQAVFPEAVSAQTFEYTAWLKEADVIINFCKLKSHGMMGMSACAKNMFGAVPGTTKMEYHYRFPDAMKFANMIVDLDEYFKPVLSIADAVVGMEGNGPTAGKPKAMSALIASRSPHAADIVCASIIGIDPLSVPTIRAAADRGLVCADIKSIDCSAPVGEFAVKDFSVVSARTDLTMGANLKGPIGKIVKGFLHKTLEVRPKLQPKECIGCGKCARICPARAITMNADIKPVIDRNVCIKCFCCQEFCEKGDMKAHRSALLKLIQRSNN